MISLRFAGTIPKALGKRPGPIVIGICSAHLFWATAVYSQRWMTSFGPYFEYQLDRAPVTMASCRLSREGTTGLLVAFSDSPQLTLYSATDSSFITPLRTIETSHPSAFLTAADIDGDRIQEGISLSPSGQAVSVVHVTEPRLREDVYRVDGRPQRCSVGDINGDGRADLLLYGHTMTGALTLIGMPGGRFTPGPLLVPDVSASDICLADVNGDGITDLLILDWLSEKLVVEYGLGKGSFAEQTRLQLPSEPGQLAAISVTAQRTFRIAITLPRAHAVAHIIRNLFGEFSIKEQIDVHGRPRDVFLTLVNGDLLPDLICPTSNGVFVSLGVTALGFGRGTAFGAGADAVSWTLIDQPQRHIPDFVLGDRNGKRLMVLKNSRAVIPTEGLSEYAVGSSPGGLVCGDFNGDGMTDVIVANGGSSTLSLLVNAGGGRLDGQIAWDVADQPTAVHAVTSPGSKSSIVLTTHVLTKQISVTRLMTSTDAAKTFTIPTGPNPIILQAEDESRGGRLSILLRYGDPRRGVPYLAVLEQLAGNRFVERTFRANPPIQSTVLTTGSFFGSARRDMAFVTRNKSSVGSAVYTARASDTTDEVPLRSALTIEDTASSIQAIASADFDNDGTEDLALFRSTPDYAVGIAYGNGEGKFEPVLQWITRVRPGYLLAPVIRDVNNDKFPDITWVDRPADTVYVLLGQAGRRFALPRSICSATGVSAFAIGNISNVNTSDLVLCRNVRHTISIITSPFAQ